MKQLQTENKAAGGLSDLTVGLGVLKVGAGDAVTYGHDGKPWPQTMDANAWAAEFCKLNSASDHGTMLGWFANAIMIGHDTALWNIERSLIDTTKTPNAALTGAEGVRVEGTVMRKD